MPVALAQVFGAAFLAPFASALSQAVRDSGGIQIVQNRAAGLSAARAWRIDRITTVDLPARFTPVEIGADYVAGLARDEDEIEQLRVYRLRKPESPE